MGINYEKINEEVYKIALGLGYKVQIFDEMGNGPISNTENARYFELLPDGIMVAMPEENDRSEVIFYVGTKKDKIRFLDLINTTKVTLHMNGVEQTIRTFNQPEVRAKDISHLARARKELGGL